MPPALPPASSPTLRLAQPSAAEQVDTWRQTHPWWGSSYTAEAYVARERLLLSVPLARDGGMTSWILTDDDDGGSHPRPVLASCETLRKRALVRAGADGVVRDVFAHGVASVFTYPEFRRRGYARRMMALLASHLAAHEAVRPGDAAFSVLFSDIGAEFYAEAGWLPYQSTHLSFPVGPASPPPSPVVSSAPILDADLAALAEADERILRDQISRPPDDPAKTRVAVLPDLDTLRWHFAREAFMSSHLFDASPTVHGAIYTPAGAPDSRVWALWTRNQKGGRDHVEKNTLDFLRFVVEDDAMADEELSKAIGAIMGHARDEARKWLCTSMVLWNPHERVKRLVAALEDLEARFVVRDNDSIASLLWLGPNAVAGIDWVANEKFEWC